MIRKFKPSDLEECLIGLPIDNWKFVDEADYNAEREYSEIMRPMMLISHIPELSGIYIDTFVHIKAFTYYETIKQSKLPAGFKLCVETAFNHSYAFNETLGCHMIDVKQDPFLFPFFVAVDAELIFKSYMKERKVNFKHYASNEQSSLSSYNEILYEIKFENKEYAINRTEELELFDGDKSFKFSYYLGANIENEAVVDFIFALMLPSKRVFRCDKYEALLNGHTTKFDNHFKKELKKIYYEMIELKRLQVISSKFIDLVFEDLIWKPLIEIRERESNDKT